MQKARYAKIASMVEQLLRQNVQTRPPIQIEVIAAKLGAEVRKGDLGDVSGLIVRKGTSAIIGVNSKQVRQRQRFTIAHELGHFLLHEGLAHHVDQDYRVNFRSDESSKATNVEEIEANFFAASILMPKKLLDDLKAVDSVESGEKVAYLAKLFDVSQHAMSLRLNNLYGQYAPF